MRCGKTGHEATESSPHNPLHRVYRRIKRLTGITRGFVMNSVGYDYPEPVVEFPAGQGTGLAQKT